MTRRAEPGRRAADHGRDGEDDPAAGTSKPAASGRPRSVSVVAPMLNESDHIERFASDVAAQDHDGPLELLVADGGSTDGSAAALRRAAERLGLDLTLVDNPRRWVSPGLNECIRRARGDVVVRMDCHTRYPPEYVRLSLLALEETGAWQVGGLSIPVGRTAGERAVAVAMQSPFGGVHWTRHGGTQERVAVDSVHCGAYRRAALERVGLFDESLVRDQDEDLAFRLRREGGTVVLDPAIRSYYVPRGSLRGVFRQYYEYGLWKTAVTVKHRRVLSARSLAPLGLVGSLGALAAAAPVSPRARRLLALETGAYGALAALAAGRAVGRSGAEWRLLPRVVATFPAFHLGYGVGNAVGWARVLADGLRRGRR